MTMMQTINGFVETMLDEQEKFKNVQNDIAHVEDEIKNIIDELNYSIENRCTELSGTNIAQKDEAMRSIFNKVAGKVSDSMNYSLNRIQEQIKGNKFIEDFEKHFTVSVFGKVKAGKSYIGNFIMGNTLRDLNIPSSYDSLRPIKVNIYDRGKLSENTELSIMDSDLDELATGKTETTSTIQWFDLGAVSWFDTPGIGSVTWENELLAKEYVKNSDLVIYACNSDAAGTRQDFDELKTLLEMEKPVLLLLTQSDTYEEDEDEDGCIISQLVPKSETDRKDQENYMIESIRAKGLDNITKYAEILTVSAKLANEAIEDNNELMFEQSNMGKLLDALNNITKNEASIMKRNTPKHRVNKMIDDIIKNLQESSHEIWETCNQIESERHELEEQEFFIVEKIRSVVNRKVRNMIDRKKSQVEKGENVREKDIIASVEKIMNEAIYEECKKYLEKAINNPLTIDLNGIGDLKREKETIEWVYTEVVKIERDPEGLFEKIGHFFGKTYYTSEIESRTRTKEIDIGDNSQVLLGRLMNHLDDYFKTSVASFVASMVKNYYEPVDCLKTDTVDFLNNAIDSLQSQRLC